MTGEIVSADGHLLGTVLAVQANFYRVQLDLVDEEDHNTIVSPPPHLPTSPPPHPPILLCTRRTRLKKIGQQVMVGDRVLVEEPDWSGGRGAIADVLPRHSQLDRPGDRQCESNSPSLCGG